jgi:hypothetical protein
MLLIAACVLALVAFRPASMGLRLAVDQRGLSFQMKAMFVKIAFDIGQKCSKADTCPKLAA